MLNIAEVLRHGQARQSHTHTDSWRLIHLTKDQCGVLKNTHFFHLKEQVRTLTGTFAHTGKHRGTGEFASDTGDHFLDQHRLAHTSATEQADLSALHVRGEQVNDLNTGFQNLGLTFKLVKRWRVAVDAPLLTVTAETRFVKAVTQCVEHVPLHNVPNRDGNRFAAVNNLGTTDKTVGWCHGNGTNQVIAEVLCHLKGNGFGDCFEGDLDSQCVKQGR